MDNMFPAGEESDASEEWHMGSSYERTPLVQVGSEVLNLAKHSG